MIMKALITEEFHPYFQKSFEENGIQCDLLFDVQTEDVLQIIQDYHIIIINSKILVDTTMIDRAPNLKIIGRVGAGMEVIDVEYAYQKGIRVYSSPEGNCHSVAEHALGMLLASFNNLHLAQNQMLKGIWSRESNRGEELRGKTVGIIGYGHTGSSFARILQGFEVDILAVDILPKTTNYLNVHFCEWEELYQRADIVSLHLPYNQSTHYLANIDFFNSFKKPIYFINTSRGKVCRQQDLEKALYDGKVIKAMLDVYETEPLEINDQVRQLCEENKLFLTPHIAGWTVQSKYLLAKTLADRVLNDLNSN